MSKVTEIKEKRFSNYFNDIFMVNHLFGLTCFISRIIPRSAKYFSKISGATIGPFEKINYSHKVYATVRNVRFYEMEYSIPEENCEEVLREIRDFIESENIRVNFPLEVRFVQADEIYLSPAFQSNRCYIGVHMYKGMKFEKYFNGCEEIFIKYDGKPHWGKIHTLTTKEIKQKYPELDKFLENRKEMDPNGIFLNPYLTELFGI